MSDEVARGVLSGRMVRADMWNKCWERGVERGQEAGSERVVVPLDVLSGNLGLRGRRRCRMAA